jgi:hypothetical protein
MSGGNITQYTQTNPGADRLMLVCADKLEVRRDNLLTTPAIACTSMPRPHVPSWAIYFTRYHRSGRQNEGMSEPAR